MQKTQGTEDSTKTVTYPEQPFSILLKEDHSFIAKSDN